MLSRNVVLILFCISISVLKGQTQSYTLSQDVRIPMRDGATLSATLVIPTGMTQGGVVFVADCYITEEPPVNLYKIISYSKFILVHVANRGKGKSDGDFIPFVNDANDNYDIIEWISKQAWCNGSIAMGGGSYLGFAQWATLKNIHPALKTVVPMAAAAPGIDFINRGQIFSVYSLRWLNYVTNTKYVDTNLFLDNIYWATIANKLYRDEIPFSQLDSLSLNTKSTFQEWLKHPGFDEYWSETMPVANDYKKITIPILTITGFFDANQRGALHYYNMHTKQSTVEGAKNHYLVIGPYTHEGAQNLPDSIVGGYKIGKAAIYDMRRLTIEWFNHVLKGYPKPDFIKDRVNCFVIDSGWKHASSVEALATDTTLFFLQPSNNHFNQLALTISKWEKELTIKVNPLDTSNVIDLNKIKPTLDFKITSLPSEEYVNASQQLIFESTPFSRPFELIGSPVADIYLKVKDLKDCDLLVSFYEIDSTGKSLPLSSQWQRMSYAVDSSKRNLLQSDRLYHFTFDDTEFIGKLVPAGSKVRFTIKVINSPWNQKNYGSGKDVASETRNDATHGTITLIGDKTHPSSISLPGKKL